MLRKKDVLRKKCICLTTSLSYFSGFTLIEYSSARRLRRANPGQQRHRANRARRATAFF